MKTVAPSLVSVQASDLPIARLDVQDTEQSLPIREYLEGRGVAVVVGRKPAIAQTYHLICGDADFVKETIARDATRSIKLFIVLFVGHGQTIPYDLDGMDAKIAVISGHAISARDAETIFAYFFTSDDSALFLESERRHPVERSPIETKRERDDAEQKRNIKKHGTLRLVLVSALALTAPILWYLVSLGMIAGLQWYGITVVRRGEMERLSLVAGVTSYWIGQGKAALRIVGVPIGRMGAADVVRSHERLLSVVGDVATAQQKAADIFLESGRMTSALFPSGDPETGDATPNAPLAVLVDRMRLSLGQLADALGLARAQLQLVQAEGRFPFASAAVRDVLGRANRQISRALGEAGSLRNLLALYRAAGGFDRKKTYLILLQNSMELRPTGGFIGSIATVGIQEGIMETPVVQDVYALDGQLKGHVDPPGPVKELLQQEHWYLRDSNWDPDFGVSGERAAWFYEKETGATVDGVIAVTTPFLTELLELTGPLDLPDYNDRVTRENFFGKSLFYTKADFFPGSTQKKDFLGSMMTAILGRLTGRQADAAAVWRVLLRAFAAGEIQVWFPDPVPAAIAQQAGWTGELVRPMPCESAQPPCMVERVGLVESNMGVNKVNFFIRAAVKSRVDIGEDGRVDGTIAVTYQNTSTGEAALSGGGTYLAYLRALLPPDARVTSATLDGEEIPSKAAGSAAGDTPPYRDPDETSGGSALTGIAFTVPQGRERVIVITYRRAGALLFTDSEATYVVAIRKQPGVTGAALDVAVGYPATWRAQTDGMNTASVQDGFLANAREVRYNTTLDQTKVFEVRFTK